VDESVSEAIQALCDLKALLPALSTEVFVSLECTLTHQRPAVCSAAPTWIHPPQPERIVDDNTVDMSKIVQIVADLTSFTR
jgi:hypothetical protein